MHYSLALSESAKGPLVLKRIVHKNRVVALRTGRQERDRSTDQFFDSPNVFYGLRGELGPGTRLARGAAPSFDRFVNRFYPSLRVLGGRQIVNFLAVQPVTSCDFDFFEAVE